MNCGSRSELRVSSPRTRKARKKRSHSRLAPRSFFSLGKGGIIWLVCRSGTIIFGPGFTLYRDTDAMGREEKNMTAADGCQSRG